MLIKKIRNLKFVIRNCNKGMTYVELIVVLSIFSVLSSVAIYNYGDFQSNVDVKNLASDIALQVVKAQKDSLSGLLPLPPQEVKTDWKPSYGVQLDLSKGEAKSFIYFVDADNSGTFDGVDCIGECLNNISISKGSYISRVEVVYWEKGSPEAPKLDNLTITFSRPNSGAVIKDNGGLIDPVYLNYASIAVSSSKGATSLIKVYASGRIQIN